MDEQKPEPPEVRSDLPVESLPPPAKLAVEQRTATAEETGSLLKKISPGALAQYPASQALYAMDAVNRSAMPLLCTLMVNAESQQREAESELKTLLEKYHSKCIELAVTKTQLRNERKIKILQNVLITVGGLLNAIALKVVFEKQQSAQALGIGLFVLGVGLIFAGWLWPKGAPENALE